VVGPKADLDTTAISQPAIFVSSMAALEKLKTENPAAYESATIAMGLSLGEYSALCFAGAFSFEDGVRLTKIRGEAMQAAANACKSGMVAVIGLDSDKVAEICKEATEKSGGKAISIANYLGKGNYVASGAKEACAALVEIAPKHGSKLVRQLDVAGAFHTQFMEPAVLQLRKALAEVKIQSPRIPVISNVDGKAHSDPDEIRDILARQVTNPVQWETIMNGMLVESKDFTKGYEIGPGSVLKNLIKKVGKQFEIESIGVE
jgi:[acyl-carrier-protein] S-malonyltransferase